MQLLFLRICSIWSCWSWKVLFPEKLFFLGKLLFLLNCCSWKAVVPEKLLFLKSCCSWEAVVPEKLLFLRSCCFWEAVVPEKLLFLKCCCSWKAIVVPEKLLLFQKNCCRSWKAVVVVVHERLIWMKVVDTYQHQVYTVICLEVLEQLHHVCNVYGEERSFGLLVNSWSFVESLEHNKFLSTSLFSKYDLPCHNSPHSIVP